MLLGVKKKNLKEEKLFGSKAEVTGAHLHFLPFTTLRKDTDMKWSPSNSDSAYAIYNAAVAVL